MTRLVVIENISGCYYGGYFYRYTYYKEVKFLITLKKYVNTKVYIYVGFYIY